MTINLDNTLKLHNSLHVSTGSAVNALKKLLRHSCIVPSLVLNTLTIMNVLEIKWLGLKQC